MRPCFALRFCIAAVAANTLFAFTLAAQHTNYSPENQPSATPDHLAPLRPGYELRETEIECGVLRWTKTKIPVLTVVCPSEGVFTPLRIVLSLSWAEASKVPDSVKSIEAEEKSLVRLRQKKGQGDVQIRMTDGKKKFWVPFAQLRGVSLVSKPD